MRADFHFHAAISKGIGFDLAFFRETLATARARGIDALAVTDHFNTQRWPELLDTFDREFDYVGPYYLAEGVRLYPGMETDVAEGVHLLVIGARDDIRAYWPRFVNHMEKGQFAPIAAYFEWQAGLDLVNIFGHPFRPGREITQVDEVYYARFDALDLNAKDLSWGGAMYRIRLEGFAGALGLPVTAGSDAHHYHQLGTVVNVFDRPCESIADLKAEIAAGAYQIEVNAGLVEMVHQAEAAKREMKLRRAKG